VTGAARRARHIAKRLPRLPFALPFGPLFGLAVASVSLAFAMLCLIAPDFPDLIVAQSNHKPRGCHPVQPFDGSNCT
jgi:hypothetical protein